MPELTFYPAFLGTFISIVAWTYLASKEHDTTIPRTLSQLNAQKHTLTYSRAVLWFCGSMFAITFFWFIVPRLNGNLGQFIAATILIGCEMLVGVFPASGSTMRIHDALAQLMGLAMLATALLFAINLHGAFATIEVGLTTLICAFGALTILDRKRFLFYELPFIFLSHISILVAAIALI